MHLKCECGNVMTDIASPNDIEHLLLSYRAKEKLQDLVDAEVAKAGEIRMWPEHWEEAGAIDVWRCPDCSRLYLNARKAPSEIVVYKLERKGL
jgi:hypothetical protein